MNIEFEDDELRRLAYEADYLGGWQPGIVKSYRRAIIYLDTIMSQRSLFHAWKGLGFHRLKGKRKHESAIWLNRKWRLILYFKNEEGVESVVVQRIEDYHK